MQDLVYLKETIRISIEAREARKSPVWSLIGRPPGRNRYSIRQHLSRG